MDNSHSELFEKEHERLERDHERKKSNAKDLLQRIHDGSPAASHDQVRPLMNSPRDDIISEVFKTALEKTHLVHTHTDGPEES